MTDIVLDVEDVTKAFPISHGRSVRALNGVSFRIRAGETLALVGESGSGKTTAGRCVLGLEKPSAGVIRYRGRDLKNGARSRGELAGKMQLVFQEPIECLNPRRTVAAIIAESLRMLGLSKPDRERRVQEAATFAGISASQLTLYPADLSAGFAQRVGIARAIAPQPDLIVLDEPTSTLDPTVRAEIVDLLTEYQQQRGASYLFISHDLGTVRYISHRVAVMYLGAIVEEAPKATLFDKPSHPYTQGLLASELLPDPRIKPREGFSLKGEIPSPIDLPPGCPLAGRCPLAADICTRQAPPRYDVAEGHWIHCHRGADAVSRSFGVEPQRQPEDIGR